MGAVLFALGAIAFGALSISNYIKLKRSREWLKVYASPQSSFHSRQWDREDKKNISYYTTTWHFKDLEGNERMVADPEISSIKYKASKYIYWNPEDDNLLVSVGWARAFMIGFGFGAIFFLICSVMIALIDLL